MKNFEKYKTPEEAFTAQVRFCQKQSKDENNCHKNGCKYSTGTTPCLLQWLYDEAEEEKEFSFCEIVKWHEVKTIPMTEEEKREYAEEGIDAEEFYVGRMPVDGQEILVKTRWGVDSDVAIAERAIAFDEFCRLQGPCRTCTLNVEDTSREACAFAWEELEAEEEELLPCPFCGCDVMLNDEKSDVLTTYKFECPICYATTSFVETTKGNAIKQWNRRTDK